MKKIIHTPHAPAPIGPYNQAVEYGGLIYLSGQIAIDPTTAELIPELGDIKAETTQVMANIQAVLTAAGSDLIHALKTSIFLSDMSHFAAVNEVYARYFDEAQAPARETVAVKGLPRGVNVEISMIVAKPQ